MQRRQRHARMRGLRAVGLHLLSLVVWVVVGLGVACADEGRGGTTGTARGVSEAVLGIVVGTGYARVGVVREGGFERISSRRRGGRAASFLDGCGNVEWPVGGFNKAQYPANHDDRFEFDDQCFISPDFQDSENAFTPQTILTAIFTKLKQDAETYLNELVEKTVIAVPAYFDDVQRAATSHAAEAAGLDVLRVMKEPLAAAMAYDLHRDDDNGPTNSASGLDEERRSDRRILVYDLGSSTLDVTVLTVEDGIFEVIATAQATHCGGDAFNALILAHLGSKFSLAQDAHAMARLQASVERAKRTLSFQDTTSIRIDAVGNDTCTTHLSPLSRALFDSLTHDLLHTTLSSIALALHTANLTPHDIDHVLLSGGASTPPSVHHLLDTYFNKPPRADSNPAHVSLLGAAKQANILSLAGPDSEALLYVAITPLSLGVEAADRTVRRVVPRGSVVPTRKKLVLDVTGGDRGEFVVRTFAGERARARENRWVGEVALTDLLPTVYGRTEVEVVFEVDGEMGITVTATDVGSGRSESFTVDDGYLPCEEIERMLEEAERSAEEDRAVWERVGARRVLEESVYGLRKRILDEGVRGDKTGSVEQEAVVRAVKEAEVWLREHDAEATTRDFEEQSEKLAGAVESVFPEAPQLDLWLSSGRR